MALFSFGRKKNKGKTGVKQAASRRRGQPGFAGGASSPQAAPKKPVEKKVNLQVAGVGLQLLMTEKGVSLQEKNVVTFRVARDASKGQIARAVEARYNAVPKKVRTVMVLAKKRRRGNTVGKTKAWKKAYVVVEDIQSFNLGV